MTSQARPVAPSQEFPTAPQDGRCAPPTRPDPPGSSWSRTQEPQHRFLAYAFSSRSPGPAHPAVLDRPDFVAAAPTLPTIPWIRLPPASPHRYDGRAAKDSHLRSDNQRLAAHHRDLDKLCSSRSKRTQTGRIDPPVANGSGALQSLPATWCLRPEPGLQGRRLR